jgi:hypothetical protein
MSVRFQEEITRKVSEGPQGVIDGVRDGVRKLEGSGKEMMHEVGDALTKGGGPGGYLAVSTPISPQRRADAARPT